MKNPPLLFTLFVSLALVMSCDDQRHDSGFAVPTAQYLSYSVSFDEGTPPKEVFDSLVVDKQTANLSEPGTDGAHMLLAEAELDALFGLFTDERNEIYSLDTIKNEQQTAVGEPDCEGAQDERSAVKCRALEIARHPVSIVAYPFIDEPHRAAPGFYFEAPQTLEIETAEMLIHLDELRARVRSEIR